MVAESENYSHLAGLTSFLESRYPAVREHFNAFAKSFDAEVSELMQLRDSGAAVIPEFSFESIAQNGFTSNDVSIIRKRGCFIVRGLYDEKQATQWNESFHDYLNSNNYFADLNRDLSQNHPLRTEHPHMLDVFWSQAQLSARQSSRLNKLQIAMNNLWSIPTQGANVFNPDKTISYGDRVRVRDAFDEKQGLAAHVDSCSLEAWFDASSIESAYAQLLDGRWQEFDAFDAQGRVFADAKPQEQACSAFRTFQGWAALTEQGQGCGTLQLIPSTRCVAWLFLHSMSRLYDGQYDPYPIPGEAFCLRDDMHGELIKGLCSLPTIKPGDSVWWHPDVMHAVEFQNNSSSQSTVMYLGSAPDCQRNRVYAKKQLIAFKKGASAPDFPDVDIETNYRGRASMSDLTELGEQIMGVPKKHAALELAE